jgi:AMP phosphorylase
MIKLRAKNLEIETGRTLVCVMHQKDADKYDLHCGDRISIKARKRKIISIIDIVKKQSIIKPGTIGLMSEVKKVLNIKNKDKVTISLEPKPDSVKYIKDKMDGSKLSKKQIETIIQDIVDNKLTDIELTYFIAACFSNSMNIEEIIAMTNAMVTTGDILKLDRMPIIDKHCIGGVAGNRTSMIIVPILASLGVTIPKTSSRAITSAAGTADTMEVLCDVEIPIKKMKQIVEKENGCIVWGGGLNLAPADDKIIFVERPMNIDSESQLIASIMAKKHSVGSTHILLDIPIGRGAKIDSKENARLLEKQFTKIGNRLGKKIKTIISDGSQPIGNGIGPALEARDVLWILKRDPRGPKDLEEKSIRMATIMLSMAGIKNSEKRVREALEDGTAYEKMIRIIEMQGRKIINPNKIKIGKYKTEIKAGKDGKISHLDNEALNKIARVAGAPEDKGAGAYLCKHCGDAVKKGETIFQVYSNSKDKLKFAMDVEKIMKSYILS